VAQASADANFAVVLTWRHREDPQQLELFDG
jgi:hypothetical protein